MKFRNLLLVCLIGISISSFAQKKQSNSELPRPKLVVGIVVDQMRWDYLYRYYDRYSDGGFRRMLNEGFTCENTNIDYVPTFTAIGHTTIYTGSVPAIHGIAGNDFIIQKTGESMYCAADTTVQTVGANSRTGQMSPRNMLTSTVTDELKLATNFRSKVVGIALKDRGGIFPAGHTGDAAYWFDDQSGNWVTSTYYMNDLPDWVKKFNAEKRPQKYISQDWNTLYPIETYKQSTEDDVRYEGKFSGTSAPVFPIPTSQMAARDYGIIRTTPYGNTLTFDLARAAVENEKMGQGEVTDFLAVSFSSTDYIGHRFAPNSIEAEDTYLRFDKELASFFSFLDSKIGKGNYTVFLSADHGAAHNPNFLTDHKIPAGVFPTSQVQRELNAKLQAQFGVAKLVLSLGNYQVNLNNKLIEEKGLDERAIRKACVDILKKRDDISFVVDMDEVQQASLPEQLRTKIINGYNREHSGIIQLVPKPGYFMGSISGTTHGTWNPYDTHIPFVLMGWGINQGRTHRPTNMSDIAPTIAALLRIQVPNGNIGNAVSEALKP